MTRRLAAVLAAAVLAGLAGCSSDDAAPATGSTTGTSPTASAMVVTTEASSGPSSSPASPSSVGVPTPSVIDVPTPTPAPTALENPWPADLTPEQVVDAQAAIAAYRAYWSVIDAATASPNAQWTTQIEAVSAGTARDSLEQNVAALVDLAAQGQRTTGSPSVELVVASVEPSLVTIHACIDTTDLDLVDSSGASVRSPNGPGTYWRHVSTAQVGKFVDGNWLVAVTEDDWNSSC